jgi:hypothetical protein
MEEGQAAGLAAALSIERRVSIPQLIDQPALIHELQAGLHGQGAYLLPDTLASIGVSSPSIERAGATRAPSPAVPSVEGVPTAKP